MRKESTAILLALAVSWTGACGAPEPLRPNLVLITADAVRPDWLVCYGADTGVGAEACALGDRGALYEWVFATAPSGAPSAASLHTSTYPTQHGVSDDPSSFLPFLGPPTLAETLRDHGYATAAFVASPELNRSRHLDRGFDHFDDRAAARADGPQEPVGARARAWTAAARPPWFVWVHFADPHGPFDGASETGDRARYRASYATALRRLDRRLSQLVAVLDSQSSPPGILLTALHGQALGEDGGPPGHGSGLSTAQIRVPLLWRSPRSGGGTGVARRIETPVSLIDVAPTLVEAAGLRVPQSFEGTPLPHSTPSDGLADRRTLFALQPNAVAVIRDSMLAVYPRAIVPTPDALAVRPVRERVTRLPIRPSRPADAQAGPGGAPDPVDLRGELARLPLVWRGGPTAGSGS